MDLTGPHWAFIGQDFDEIAAVEICHRFRTLLRLEPQCFTRRDERLDVAGRITYLHRSN
jgi:hypothetical protein